MPYLVLIDCVFRDKWGITY